MELEIDLTSLSMTDFNQFTIIDVREGYELEMQPVEVDTCVHFPLSTFDGNLANFNQEKQYLVVCAHGMRSAGFTQYLRENGFSKVFSVPEGIDSLNQFIQSHSQKPL